MVKQKIKKESLSGAGWIGWTVLKVGDSLTRSNTYTTKQLAVRNAEKMIEKGYARDGIYVINISSAWLVKKE